MRDEKVTKTDQSSNPNLHPVVVGIDFDAPGLSAVDQAIGMATMGLMEIHICHAIEPRPELDTSERQMKARHEEVLRFVRAHVPAELEQRVRMHLAVADPADALAQLAVDVDADLIVVGTHGKKGITRLVKGSVGHDLLQKAPCPVLVAIPPARTRKKVPVEYGKMLTEGSPPYRISTRGLTPLG
jgi:nucleotide-binding universal stress UspA family protein